MTLSAEEPATQDIYIEVTRGIEKQRWMLMAHLDKMGSGGRMNDGRAR
jgi:DNA-binding ferritin-like protein